MLKIQTKKIQASKIACINSGVITMNLSLPQGFTGTLGYYISGTTTIYWGHNLPNETVSTGTHYSPYLATNLWTIYLKENGGEGLSLINFQSFYITDITFYRCNNIRMITLTDNLLTNISFKQTPNVTIIDLFENNISDAGYDNILYNELPIGRAYNGYLFTYSTYGISQDAIDYAAENGWIVILD